jgi:hypothetical protein
VGGYTCSRGQDSWHHCPRGGSPSDLSAWTAPRVRPIGPASLERPTGFTHLARLLRGQDLAAGMLVGRFYKLLAHNSIIVCVVWEWEISEVAAYVLHAVSNYICIHIHAQHECEHVCPSAGPSSPPLPLGGFPPPPLWVWVGLGGLECSLHHLASRIPPFPP